MTAVVDACESCMAAMRAHERVVSRQARLEASGSPVFRRRMAINELEQERRLHEMELELSVIELLEACHLVNDTWTDARTRDARLTGYVQGMLVRV